MNTQKHIKEFDSLTFEINNFSARLNDHIRYFSDLVYHNEFTVDDELEKDMKHVLLKLRKSLKRLESDVLCEKQDSNNEEI